MLSRRLSRLRHRKVVRLQTSYPITKKSTCHRVPSPWEANGRLHPLVVFHIKVLLLRATLTDSARKGRCQGRVSLATFNSIPPTYAPPSPPPTGKTLTNRQKIALAATIIFVLLLFIVPLLLRHYLG